MKKLRLKNSTLGDHGNQANINGRTLETNWKILSTSDWKIDESSANIQRMTNENFRPVLSFSLTFLSWTWRRERGISTWHESNRWKHLLVILKYLSSEWESERKEKYDRERDRDARAIDRVILWKKGRKIYCIFPFPRFDNSLQYWMWLMYREWVKRELEMDPLQRLICEGAKKFPLCIFIQV